MAMSPGLDQREAKGPRRQCRSSLLVRYADGAPHFLAQLAIEEDMVPIFCRVVTAPTDGVLHHMFVKQIKLGTESVFKIQPSKKFNFIWHFGSPNPSPVIHVFGVERLTVIRLMSCLSCK